mmetsp:Transcript_1227/g.1407  ORF Transcript_1227/g.1407 Transcript_1227/m.1407 type:complete len:172 (+) Transcript_1227:707-1222(+)
MGVKRVMITQEKQYFERKIRDEENEYYRKRQQRDEIDQGKRHFIQMKVESKRMIENQQKQNYLVTMQDRNNKISKLNEKVDQLEEVEKLLVEKLGMTQMNQHQALANLHKVVQICNSGINLKSKPDLKNLNSNSSHFQHSFNTLQHEGRKPGLTQKLNVSSVRNIEGAAAG